MIDCVWNVMAHAQKPDFVFRRKGRVHLNRRGRQFSRLLADEVCALAAVMLDTPCSELVWRVLATHSIRQFTLHFPSRASPCAITFQLDSTYKCVCVCVCVCVQSHEQRHLSYCRMYVLQTRTLLLLNGSDHFEDLAVYVAVIQTNWIRKCGLGSSDPGIGMG